MKMSDFVTGDRTPEGKLDRMIKYALHMMHEYKGKNAETGIGNVATDIANQTGLEAFGIGPRELVKRYEQALKDGMFEDVEIIDKDAAENSDPHTLSNLGIE